MQQQQLKMLIVDDDEADLMFFRSAIKSIGARIDLRHEPRSENTIAIIHEDRPHLVVLDNKIPGQTGLDLLKAIKSDPEILHTPVIILSSSEDRSDISACYREGANAYLTKPFTPDGYHRMALHLTSFWFNEAKLP